MSTSVLARVERCQLFISGDGGTTWTAWDGVVTGGSGGTSSVDGASFTANTSSGTAAMGAYQSVVSAVTDGDLAILGMTAQRALKVTLFDTAGNEQAAGGGTQYTEDAASAANPVGNAVILRRRDTPVITEVSAENNNIAAIATSKGELYVKHLDAIPVTDNGGSLTVDATTLTTIAGAVAGAEMQVDVVTSALPTGAATLAEQQTQSASLSVMDDWDESDRAKVNPIAGQAGVQGGSGTTNALTQRVVLATDVALPAGTNAIGKLSANSGVDIGDVDVTSSALPTGASTLAEQQSQTTHLATLAGAVRAEDAAHSTGHTGIMGLSVRQDTAAALANADADYQPLITDASGRLHVNVGNTVTVASHAVTNAGTFVVQENGAALTALQLIDDVVIADDAAFTPATTKVAMAGFTFDDAAPDSVNEGDGGAARMSANRNIYVTIRDAAGNERGLNVDADGALLVKPTSSATGGDSTMNASSSDGATALTNSAQVIKASAGTLTGYYIYNPNATAQFVQFYNTAAGSVTVGTTATLFMLTIPATSAANLADLKIAFGTAMSWAATSTAGGNGAPTTAFDAVCWYK